MAGEVSVTQHSIPASYYMYYFHISMGVSVCFKMAVIVLL